MSDDASNIGKAAIILVIWVLALIEPTPIGEGIAVPVTLGVLGMDDGGSA